ncbi:MAG: hypothetical protein IPG73_00025 [Ignavibacteria bacterium]|nr:hypothetical protein [Ignavibacteria bacterium]
MQGPHRYLYTHPTGDAFRMKPDIVIGLSNGPDPIVVDTKWKLLDTSSTYAGRRTSRCLSDVRLHGPLQR